jgi:hypothetical protein
MHLPGFAAEGALSESGLRGLAHRCYRGRGPMDGVVEGVAQEARASRSVIGKFLLAH